MPCRWQPMARDWVDEWQPCARKGGRGGMCLEAMSSALRCISPRPPIDDTPFTKVVGDVDHDHDDGHKGDLLAPPFDGQIVETVRYRQRRLRQIYTSQSSSLSGQGDGRRLVQSCAKTATIGTDD
uniref:Uncharacterized protein n=1 Tax=Panagrellus redivivus TaxID=6233 RepID=A0A7E4V738_PANRE